MAGVLREIFLLLVFLACWSAESLEKGEFSSDDEDNPNEFVKVVNNEELLHDFAADHTDSKDNSEDPVAKGRVISKNFSG